MNEKEFNFKESPPDDPELETPEEIQVESEDEEVREVSLIFPENEAWPPQPEIQETPDATQLSSSDQVKTYSEAVEDLNQEKPEKEDGEQDPVRMYNGKPVNSLLVANGTKLEGFYFYTIKHQTGITLNGKHFDAGSHWFDQSTYEGILIIDLPFQ